MTPIDSLPRLAYLATEHQPKLPPRHLLRYVPQAKLLQELTTLGIAGAAVQLGLRTAQVQTLVEAGSAEGGRGNIAEFTKLLTELILSEIDMRRADLSLSQYMGLLKDLAIYSELSSDGLVAFSEVSLGDAPLEIDFPKWPTGFTPLDMVLDGCYQALMMVMGKSGHGKTSLMLTLMEELRSSIPTSEIWFFETEIPQNLMLYRLQPARERTKFKKADRLVCGQVSIHEILQQVRQAPNPHRILFIDSPDVMVGGIGEGRRFALESIFRELVTLKELCKLVVVGSQVRRADASVQLESAAEAWAKVWYCDIAVGVRRMVGLSDRETKVRLNVVKNRFGTSGQFIDFDYNYGDLSWAVSSEPQLEGEEPLQ